MKLTKEITITIEVTEKERFLAFSFKGGEMVEYDSNLPYEKSPDDWNFYWKAIKKIMKEFNQIKKIK